ncbi:MAG: 23S rRNA (pseudouridine(1915)-N(3))-methyltransferase RlmH [Lachnospiraceae bacterium]|nr:23S rRNA (pseudouridine(1915)-N(3))-methyltransferase RlmH [Lachnospiraceae bacterium]MBQ9233439.1 23S rRNA (pseudouridine(1915)-N(3))-methyltransferase RlmH [Lachnospiraceae bacterium]
MDIILHIEGKKLDTEYEKALNEYIKRTLPFANIKKKLYKDIAKLSVQKKSYVFIINYGTDSCTSEEIAKMITDINISGYSCIEFIISDKPMSDYETFTLSSMHLGNDIAAVCLTEQIYRAYTIINNINYHK